MGTTLKQVTTIKTADVETIQLINLKRLHINSSRSRLTGMVPLLLELCKDKPPAVVVHKSSSRIQERYSAQIGDYFVSLTVLSYSSSDNVPSAVKHPSTVIDLHGLRDDMVARSNPDKNDVNKEVFLLPMKLFSFFSTACQYQADIDDDVWSISFCDRACRTSTTIEFVHSTMNEEAAVC